MTDFEARSLGPRRTVLAEASHGFPKVHPPLLPSSPRFKLSSNPVSSWVDGAASGGVDGCAAHFSVWNVGERERDHACLRLSLPCSSSLPKSPYPSHTSSSPQTHRTQSHRTARLEEPLETGARPSDHAMGKRRPGWGATCPGTWSRQGAVWLPAQDLCTGPQHPTMFPDARGISSGPVCHLFPHSDTSSMEAGLWLPLAARSQELGTGLPPGELIIK